MATSASFKERKRKPESVQFWLAIAAVSLLFHAGLIVGLKRWATIALVEPDGGSIAVELVDPASEADAPPGEPIVQAAALKPDAKPAPEPIASPEPEIPSSFEPKFEPAPIVKPEPIVPPEKKPQPIVPKPENNTKPPNRPSPKTDKKDDKKEPSKEIPTTKRNPLPLPTPTMTGIDTVNFQVLGEPQLTPQSQGELSGTAVLKVPPFPPIDVPKGFPLRRGETLDVTLNFYINNVTGQIDSPTFPKIPNLDDKEREQLEIAVAELLGKIMFSPPDVKIEGGAPPPESTEWRITLRLTGQ